MRQAPTESNSADVARGKSQRHTVTFTICAGLITAAIVAAGVLGRPSEQAQSNTDLAVSNTATPSSARAEDGARPHFERADEPAVEESVNAHGG